MQLQPEHDKIFWKSSSKQSPFHYYTASKEWPVSIMLYEIFISEAWAVLSIHGFEFKSGQMIVWEWTIIRYSSGYYLIIMLSEKTTGRIFSHIVWDGKSWLSTRICLGCNGLMGFFRWFCYYPNLLLLRMLSSLDRLLLSRIACWDLFKVFEPHWWRTRNNRIITSTKDMSFANWLCPRERGEKF